MSGSLARPVGTAPALARTDVGATAADRFALSAGLDPGTPARRLLKAADDARPFSQTEADKKAEADALKDALSELKKTKPRDDAKIATTEVAIDVANKAAREAANKAQAIEDAVYDLKAVNPNKKADVDTRTPTELLDLIDAKGREVTEALAALRGMQQSGAGHVAPATMETKA